MSIFFYVVRSSLGKNWALNYSLFLILAVLVSFLPILVFHDKIALDVPKFCETWLVYSLTFTLFVFTNTAINFFMLNSGKITLAENIIKEMLNQLKLIDEKLSSFNNDINLEEQNFDSLLKSLITLDIILLVDRNRLSNIGSKFISDLTYVDMKNVSSRDNAISSFKSQKLNFEKLLYEITR